MLGVFGTDGGVSWVGWGSILGLMREYLGLMGEYSGADAENIIWLMKSVCHTPPPSNLMEGKNQTRKL